MKVGVDLDSTANAAPKVYQSLMSALMAAGHKVYVLTGIDDKKVTKQDIQEKTEYLRALGLGDAYDKLKVFPQEGIGEAKAAYCQRKGVDLLIDDRLQTARLADKYCVVLVPWTKAQDDNLKVTG